MAEPSDPTPTTPPTGETPLPPSWTRHLSQSSIPRPALPSVSGLRSALLGYISEVERAVRESVVGEDEDGGDIMASPSSYSGVSGSGEDDAFGFGAANAAAGSSSSLAGPSNGGLRRRLYGDVGDGLGPRPRGDANGAGGNNSLLNHLSSLREDVTRYLPHIPVPSASNLGARGEWLRSLPHRLRLVDLSVGPLPPDARMPASPVLDDGSVAHARRRVISLAKALLPSEEWAGWERLGWEEQDAEGTSRRHSFDLAIDPTIPLDEEEEEEPEYLFPNRTPASAQAFASRRRAVRSKSLGAANFRDWMADVKDLQTQMPKLQRTRTEPYKRDVSMSGGRDDALLTESEADDEDEEDELDAAEMLAHPELYADLKLGRVGSGTILGPSVAEALRSAEDGKRLIEYEDLPFLWRNNEHILTGYRFIPLHASTGPIPLFKSAFTWHNETVNIHSHFIPTILILLFIPAIIYSSPMPDPHPLDTATLVVYLFAAVSCLISSAGWHVLSGCASYKWFEWGACVDYIGISWLIAASFFTVLYNAFYCQPKTVLLYSTVNLVCGILGSYLPFQKWFNERKYKNWRINFFLFLCFAMFAPMLQLFYQHGWARGRAFCAPFVPSIIAYVSGLLFYAFHWPECQWPGRFDRWGMSHNLWHAGIVIAIILHYRAIFAAHTVRYEYSCAMRDAGMPVGEVVEKGWWILMRSLGLAEA